MAKLKFYVVWDGHQKGVFSSWKECELSIKSYNGAKYKSYETEAEARKAFSEPYQKHIYKNAGAQKNQTSGNAGKPILQSISVDAAFSSASKNMEYQGVYTADKSVWFKMGPLPKGTNNVGEFLAIVHALALCKQKKINLPIYTDSITAMAWVRNKRAKTTLDEEPDNEKLFEYIDRAEKWLKENTWTNKILKWDTRNWGEIPADFGRK